MPNPYREIFKANGAMGFAAAGFVARLPIAMAPIGIVAMLSQTHGEYWLAGAVSATFALANAFLAPQISRLVDRLGQTRIVVPTTVISVLAFAILIAAANQDWPTWTLFVSALLAAAMPSIPAMVRARWTEIFRGRPEMNTAFAFEFDGGRAGLRRRSVAISGAECRLVPGSGNAGEHIVPRLRFDGFHPAALDRAASATGGTWFARLGNPLASGSDHHLRPDLHRRDLRDHGSDHRGASPRSLGQPGAASLVIGVYALGSFVRGDHRRRAQPENAAAAPVGNRDRHHRAHHAAAARRRHRAHFWRWPSSSAA